MSPVFLIPLLSLLAACDDDGAASGGDVDPSYLTSSSGEVALADGGTMAFVITSERYKQWDAARRALDRKVAARFGTLLQPAAPTEQSIDRAVAYLEQDARSSRAIERAGLSVRGFVELTVALEQQMRLVGSRRSSRAEPLPLPMPDTFTRPVDSGYVPAPPITPLPFTPLPQAPTPAYPRSPDSAVRSDTLFPRSQPRDDTLSRRPASSASDSVVPRRDTLTPARPAARDSVRDTRDTLRPVAPDTIGRR